MRKAVSLFFFLVSVGILVASMIAEPASARTRRTKSFYYTVQQTGQTTTVQPTATPSTTTTSPTTVITSTSPTTPYGYHIDNKDGITIDGGAFSSKIGTCLSISNSKNIVIKNAQFLHCFGVGIGIEKSSNVKIYSNYFEDVNGGIHAADSQQIVVNANKFKNVSRINKSDPARGQFVQFRNVTGAGSLIQYNIGVNEPGLSDPEDLVNLSQSEGTAASPITVSGNCFKGGGPSLSGGGIMLGDGGGKYQKAENNTLVDPGQYGIAIAGGSTITVLNNKVYARPQSFTNVGIYIWNQSATSCSGHTMQGNSIKWYNSNSQSNPYWNAGNCGNITGESQNDLNADLAGLNCAL